jgi:hypothetical protein
MCWLVFMFIVQCMQRGLGRKQRGEQKTTSQSQKLGDSLKTYQDYARESQAKKHEDTKKIGYRVHQKCQVAHCAYTEEWAKDECTRHVHWMAHQTRH